MKHSFVLFALLSIGLPVCSVQTLLASNADTSLAVSFVSALEQRFSSFESEWSAANRVDDLARKAEAELNIRETATAVRVLRSLIDNTPEFSGSYTPSDMAVYYKNSGKALVWEGVWNTLCGSLAEACVSPIRGDVGAVLTALTVIVKIYGITQIGVGAAKLLMSIVALPRPSIAIRLAALDEEIHQFMDEVGIALREISPTAECAQRASNRCGCRDCFCINCKC